MPPKRYQYSRVLAPVSTLLTALHRHIPYQPEIDGLLKNFNAKVLPTYILPIHAAD